MIFKEECQNFPYASFSLDDKQVKADDELFTLVKQHQDAVDARMEKRLTYIQENYINQNKPLVDKQQYETSSAVGALDKLLRESRVALVVNDDTSYTDKQNVL
ncbi:MAG: hypothetical protein LBP53_03145 [Candidatus Peribacteria bacterium]|nr:hypothetical protein [Candidatus Peribacteria bacterium]